MRVGAPISSSSLRSTVFSPFPRPFNSDVLLKPIVSRDKYERIFRSHNLRFGSGKSDVCSTCASLIAVVENNHQTSMQRGAAQTRLDHHLLRSKSAAEQYDADRRLSVRSWEEYHGAVASGVMAVAQSVYTMTVDTIEVGFQPNRPAPQLQSAAHIDDAVYLSRQMWVYHYGIYSAPSQTAETYLWDQRTGKRQVNEIISAMWKHMTQATDFNAHTAAQSNGHNITPIRRAPHLIVFGDGFRHFYGLCFFAELCREASQYFSYRRIDYKLFEPGHSTTDCERLLSGIERDGRLLSVTHPTEWQSTLVKLADKKAHQKVRVASKWLQRSFILDWVSVLSPLYTNEYTAVDVDGAAVDLTKAVWFNFGIGKDTFTPPNAPPTYHPDEVWVRFSFSEYIPWRKIRIIKHVNERRPQPNLTPLYDEEQTLPMSQRKLRDLMRLRKYIPSEHHDEYPGGGDGGDSGEVTMSSADSETDVDDDLSEADRFRRANVPPIDDSVSVGIIHSATPTSSRSYTLAAHLPNDERSHVNAPTPNFVFTNGTSHPIAVHYAAMSAPTQHLVVAPPPPHSPAFYSQTHSPHTSEAFTYPNANGVSAQQYHNITQSPTSSPPPHFDAANATATPQMFVTYNNAQPHYMRTQHFSLPQQQAHFYPQHAHAHYAHPLHVTTGERDRHAAQYALEYQMRTQNTAPPPRYTMSAPQQTAAVLYQTLSASSTSNNASLSHRHSMQTSQ